MSGPGRSGTTPAPRRTVEEAGLVGAAAVAASQTVALTAVLYYFGWARTNAFLGHFGLDTSLVGYTTTDYLLRSISVAFPAAVGVAVLALLVLGAHRAAVPHLDRRGSAEHLVTGVLAVAGLVLGVVAAGLLLPDRVGSRLGPALPLLVVLLAGLVGYVDHLRRRYPGPAGRTADAYRPFAALRPAAPAPLPAPPGAARAPLLLALGLGLLAAFWAAGLQADADGRLAAVRLVERLDSQPQVVLYSDHRLQLTGPGVQVDELGPAGDRFRYRYSGLRKLIRSDQLMLLLPVEWRQGRDRVFIVPDGEGARLDVIAPPRPGPDAAG